MRVSVKQKCLTLLLLYASTDLPACLSSLSPSSGSSSSAISAVPESTNGSLTPLWMICCRVTTWRSTSSKTRGDNVLNLLLTSASDNDTLSQFAVRSTCFVACRLHVPLLSPTISRCCCRDIRLVDLVAFHSDIQQSPSQQCQSAALVTSLAAHAVCKMRRRSGCGCSVQLYRGRCHIAYLS